MAQGSFPIVRSTRTVSGQGPGVTANIDVSTGAKFMAQAVAHIGQAIQGIGVRYDEIEAANQLSQANRLRRESINRATLKMQDNNTPASEYPRIRDESLAEHQTYMPKNAKAARGYSRTLDIGTPVFSLAVENAKLGREQDTFKAEIWKDIESATTPAQFAKINDRIDLGVTQNIYGKEEAVKLKSQVNGFQARAGSVANMDAIYIDLSPLGPTKALEKLQQMTGLTTAERNALEARFATDKSLADEQKEAEKLEIDTASVVPQTEFLANYENIINSINESTTLTTKDKEDQRKKVGARFDAIKAGKVDPINTWDADAYNNLATKIRRSPYSVKFSDIRNKVGLGKKGGITLDQSDVLTELLRKYTGADVVEKGRHAVYSSAINGMRTAKAFSLDKTENSIMAAEAMTLLDAWAIKQEDPTDVDYHNFFDRLTSTADLGWWDRFWVGNDKNEGRLAVGRNLAKLQQEVSGKPLTERPAKYPDAVWNSEHNTWTVIRDGRLKGIE